MSLACPGPTTDLCNVVALNVNPSSATVPLSGPYAMSPPGYPSLVPQVLPTPLLLPGGVSMPIAMLALQLDEQVGPAPALNRSIVRNSGPHRPAWRDTRGPCRNCRQWGHFRRFSPNSPVPTLQPLATPQKAEPDRVQQVSGTKELWDVYVPIQLFNRKTVAVLDTGCDTSIIGARLLPSNACV